MEIEKRKQAEEALGNLHKLWQSMSHRLSFVGLMLPPPPAIVTEDKGSTSLDVDPVENLGQQLLISKLVVESIGRACSRAEIQLEMEPLINAKKFEIARLWDRLQYYESANREMSQRNQEAVEMARQQRNKRKRRQKWIWRSITRP
ncbi:hypothetical protein Taro_027263, partial [Colocasia esculenta]|nr:hypothetical protein [Colocasia esculenta]